MKKNVTEGQEKNMSAKEIFAKNLQIQITNSGKSKYRVAKELEMTPQYLYYLLDPKNRRQPSMDTIEKFANYFGIDSSVLLSKSMW